MSFGEDLRRERELRQISLNDVAQATKINIRYLDAMERNDFLHLPGGVFNRGFVRAYCEFIGVSSEAMVNAYLVEERSQATRSRGSESIQAIASGPTGPAKVRGRSRVLLLGGLGLLLVAAALAVTVSAWFSGKLTVLGGSADAPPPARDSSARDGGRP
jgi:cytoskeleton protein RodZ